MTRLEHYIKSIDKYKSMDAKEGALIVMLVEYSHNIISRMDGDTRMIKEWLESEVKA